MKLVSGFIISLVLTLAISASATVGSVNASGFLTTSQATQAGQVRVVNQNGTLYLTNDIVAGETSTVSGIAATRSGFNRIINLYPPGFAKSASQMIRAVLNLILILAVLLVFFYIVWAAFDWLTSGGDKGKTEKARQKIISAVIGIIIIVSSYAILSVVTRFLGFNVEEGLTIPSIRDFPPSQQQPYTTPSGTFVPTPQPTWMPTPRPTPTPVVIEDDGTVIY